MPIYAISDVLFKILPADYWMYIVGTLTGFLFVRAWALGRRNTRDRDLHGRTILVTGGLTPLGVTIMTSLAERGAQVIALLPSLSDPLAQLLVPVLQQTTSNPLVFAEQCDITSPQSIRAFHSQFVKGRTGTGMNEEATIPRIDALVLLHEYAHVGMSGALKVSSRAKRLEERRAREVASYGTFLLTTIFLPFLIRAPADRDIRIINAVNPLYAAAVTGFDPTTSLSTSTTASISQLEGDRALRGILFARHCQRVLNALANPAPPTTDQDPSHEPVISAKHESNIKVVTACPGFSRSESIAPFLGASSEAIQRSVWGSIIYFILAPLFLLLAKSAKAASQTPLYTLFMPHPAKKAAIEPTLSTTDAEPVPTIQGGELYRECAPVRLPTERGGWLMNDESVGRAVWEYFEQGVEKWEKEEKERMAAAPPSETTVEEDQGASVDEGDLDSALPGLVHCAAEDGPATSNDRSDTLDCGGISLGRMTTLLLWLTLSDGCRVPKRPAPIVCDILPQTACGVIHILLPGFEREGHIIRSPALTFHNMHHMSPQPETAMDVTTPIPTSTTTSSPDGDQLDHSSISNKLVPVTDTESEPEAAAMPNVKLSPVLKQLLVSRSSNPLPGPSGQALKAVFQETLDSLRSSVKPKPQEGFLGGPLCSWLVIATATLLTTNTPSTMGHLYRFATAEETTNVSLVQKAERTAVMREAGLKCAVLVGIPRTINTLGALREATEDDVAKQLERCTFQARDLSTKEATVKRGETLFESIYTPHAQKLLAKLGQSHPDFPGFIIEHAYGGILSNPSSTPLVSRTLTSALAVSCLRTQGRVGPQLTSHVFGLLKAGVEANSVQTSTEKWLSTEEGAEWVIGAVDELRDVVEAAERPSKL